MRTPAAILIDTQRPLEVVDLDVPALKPGQALVEVAFSGVCHTQLLEARGLRGPDRFLPHCLGHEGSGRVIDVASGVSHVGPGDAVVLSWIKGPGADVPGAAYGWGSRTVNAGGVTTFQRYAVVSENRLTRVDATLPLDQAALLGCAAPTGIGAVRHTGQARPGESVIVFGCGGVGLCAVAGARAVGCDPIIAVDLHGARLEAAKALGATRVCHPGGGDLPTGVDLAIEATGRCDVMAQALEHVRPRGGRVVLVGNAPHGSLLTLDPQQFNQGKQLRGTWGGDTLPPRDVPDYARWITQSRIDLRPLIDRAYPLNRINQALLDLEQGRAIRPLIQLHTN